MTARPQPMSLASLQDFFLTLVREPEGVEEGIRNLEANGLAAGRLLSEHFAGDERLPALDRVDIYANMYFFRLKDVLADDFSRTAGVLGEAGFHNLVTGFLMAHPPTEPSLRWLGRPLPDYLAASTFATSFPFLPDLARLEWEWLDCFQSEDGETLDPAVLMAVAAEDWPALRFSLHPSVRLVPLQYDVSELFLDPESEMVPVERPHTLLMYRDSDEDPVFFELPPAAVALFKALGAGKSFAEACEAASEAGAGEEAGSLAASYIASALERNLFSGSF